MTFDSTLAAFKDFSVATPYFNSKDCPQRPFESMISTLKKLPWYPSICQFFLTKCW